MKKLPLILTSLTAVLAAFSISTSSAATLSGDWLSSPNQANNSSSTWQFYQNCYAGSEATLGNDFLPSFTTTMYGQPLQAWYQNDTANGSNNAMIGKAVTAGLASFTGPNGYIQGAHPQGTVLMTPQYVDNTSATEVKGIGIGFLASGSGNYNYSINIQDVASGYYRWRLDTISTSNAITNLGVSSFLNGGDVILNNSVALGTGDRLVFTISLQPQFDAAGQYPMLRVNDFTVVPEPSTVALLGGSVFALALGRYRMRKGLHKGA